MRIMGVTGGDEGEKDTEKLLRNNRWEFANLGEELDFQEQEANRTPNFLNKKGLLQGTLY